MRKPETEEEKAAYNEYMRKYMLERYHKLRNEALQRFGGKCVQCGATENLEFDHIDPSTKVGQMGDMFLWAKARREAELLKCQLLCSTCHSNKTIVDLGQQKARGEHGRISTRRYCACDLCKKAHADYCKDWTGDRTIEKRNQNRSKTTTGNSIGRMPNF